MAGKFDQRNSSDVVTEAELISNYQKVRKKLVNHVELSGSQLIQITRREMFDNYFQNVY